MRSNRRVVATWSTWDWPDGDRCVAHWAERDIAVVFPLQWAERGQAAMIARARERIAELEGHTRRHLAPGSVLLAFSPHRALAAGQMMNPDVSRSVF